MNLLKSSLIAPSLALLLSTNLFAQENYTIKANTLTEALEIIAKKAKLPYIVEESLIKGKQAPTLQDITGVQNALKEVLKNTNLEAIIKNETIIIKKKVKTNNDSSNLGEVDVLGTSNNISENSNSYSINSMSTSTKMDLSIFETPQTVSVITNQKMKDYALNTINEVLEFAPGITVEDSESERTKYTSRGFDISNFQVDGINLPLSDARNYGDEDTIIYDHIEITRGASGLTSGAGDPSATINMIRKKPTKEFQANTSLIIGSENKKKISADISGSISNTFRARAIVSKENSESYLDRYKTDNNLFYTIFEANLSDSTLLTFGYKRSNENPKSPMWGALQMYYTNGTATNFDRSANTAASWSYWDITKTELFSTLSQDFNNDWQVNVALTKKKTKLDSDLFYIYKTPTAGTNLGLTGFASNYRKGETNEKSIDIHAKGPYELFGYENSAIIGLSYAQRKTNETSLYDSINGSPSIGDFTKWKGKTPYPNLVDKPEIAHFIDKEKAIYLASNIHLSDDISLILGGRLTTWEKNVIEHKALKSSKSSSILTPYAGIVYTLNDNNMIYGSYTNSFTPQAKIDKNSKQLNPTESVNYEIGTKGSYFDNKLHSAFSLFRINQKNAPQNEGKLTDGSNYYSVNDGITSSGFTAEVTGSFITGLNNSISYSNLRIKDTKGNEIRTYIPKQTIKLATTYTFQSMQNLKIGASINWQDDIYREQGKITVGAKTGQNAITRQESYALINLMTQYKINKNLEATLNINNITNKKYLTSLYYKNQSFYGAPRSAYLTLKWTY